MKIRSGFVSNSSTTSFVVNKRLASEFQLVAIRNLVEAARAFGSSTAASAGDWSIKEKISDGIPVIEGFAWMDNFGIESFFEKLMLPKEAYVVDSDNFPLDENEGGMEKINRWVNFERD